MRKKIKNKKQNQKVHEDRRSRPNMGNSLHSTEFAHIWP
jgi:hypothetical protein